MWSIFSLWLTLSAVSCLDHIPEQILRGGRSTLDDLHIEPANDDHIVRVKFTHNGQVKLRAELGYGLPTALGQPEVCDGVAASTSSLCYKWKNQVKLEVSVSGEENVCERVEWSSTSSFVRKFVDCFLLEEGSYWYGGGDTYNQAWPINKKGNKIDAPVVSGNPVLGQNSSFGGITENYWLISKGVVLHFDEDTPLSMNIGTTEKNSICFAAQDTSPYSKRETLTLKYSICMGDDIREILRKWIRNFYPKPNEIPDLDRFLRPSWSTSVHFGQEVNEKGLLEYAESIIGHGFLKNSHIELDNHWESCYGDMGFDFLKFPNPKAMVSKLKELGFKTTLWVHPFVNHECESFKEALKNKFLVRDEKTVALTHWDQGENAGVIDFTNPKGVEWWRSRLDALKEKYGIDSFRFIGGHTAWLPNAYKFDRNNVEDRPNVYTTKYAQLAASYGNLTDANAVRGNQNLSMFVRLLEKESNWGAENGLKSIIPSVLHANLLGYYFTLTNAIGGSSLSTPPSAELYIRWAQVNAFMPSLEISKLPWNVSNSPQENEQIVQALKNIIEAREKYTSEIYSSAYQAIYEGSPMIHALWWDDPKDPETYTIDDEYMLGMEILVAPIVTQGQVSRDIYLPKGTWKSASEEIHQGPTWLRKYPAPLLQVPYFVKQGIEADVKLTEEHLKHFQEFNNLT